MPGLLAAMVIGLLAASVTFALVVLTSGLHWRIRAGAMQRAAQRSQEPLRLITVKRTELAPNVVEFTLTHPRHRRLPAHTAGQHIVLRVPVGSGRAGTRAYSLAEWQHTSRRYMIAVKREADGLVSRWLFDKLESGALIEALPPRGAFTTERARQTQHVLLIAGGIGITPLRAMLQYWQRQPRPLFVTLHYSARTRGELIYHEEFETLRTAHDWFQYEPRLTGADPAWSGLTGRLSAALILKDVADLLDATVFICASRGMEHALAESLVAAGLPAERIHRESFALLHGATPIRHRVRYRGRVLEPGRARTLLEILQHSRIDVPSECRVGECGMCRVRVMSGRTEHIVTRAPLSDSVLSCCAVPVTDVEVA